MSYCSDFAPGEKPQVPTYYELPPEYPYYRPILGQQHYEFFYCNKNSFSLFSKHCGDLTNPTYNQFHPYAWFWGLTTLMIPISLIISFFIVWIFICIVKFIQKISICVNFNKIKNFIKSLKKAHSSDLSLKLQELNMLREQGLITEDDYNCKKAKLLDEF